MKLRFKNARILTMEQPLQIIEGELWVENNLITYVGEKPSNITEKFDKTIDVERNLLMPGFKNAHTHSAMSFLRSYADDLPLHDWLNNLVFPAEALLKDDDEYHLAKVSILEYLTSGVTAAFDMYYKPELTAQAAVDLGFRIVCLGTVTKYRESVEEMVEAYKKLNNHPSGLVSYELGFHAIYTASKEILSELKKAADKLKAPIYTHLAETKVEFDNCMETHGMTPTAFIDSLGLWEYGGGGFHGIYVTDEDLDIMKKSGLYIVSNPSSNVKIASGIAPITKYLEKGVPVAIGTDGPASNNALDFFREMWLVSTLSKLDLMDASVVDALEVLNMATVNGAHAMRLYNADILKEGKYADVIMIDLNTPNMQPINNILKNIIYAGAKSNIKMTMVNGNILYYDGEFYLNEDVSEIYKKAQAITERIKVEMNK